MEIKDRPTEVLVSQLHAVDKAFGLGLDFRMSGDAAILEEAIWRELARREAAGEKIEI